MRPLARSLRSGDNIATGGSSSRSTENGVGQRTRGNDSLPLPIRGGRDKRDPPPMPCTTARAHPSCDRLRGSLRSGDMSPLWMRNIVAVATSATLPPCHARRRGRRRHYSDRLRGSLRSGDMSPLPTTIYQLSTKCNRKSQIEKSQIPKCNRKSQIVNRK